MLAAAVAGAVGTPAVLVVNDSFLFSLLFLLSDLKKKKRQNFDGAGAVPGGRLVANLAQVPLTLFLTCWCSCLAAELKFSKHL